MASLVEPCAYGTSSAERAAVQGRGSRNSQDQAPGSPAQRRWHHLESLAGSPARHRETCYGSVPLLMPAKTAGRAEGIRRRRLLGRTNAPPACAPKGGAAVWKVQQRFEYGLGGTHGDTFRSQEQAKIRRDVRRLLGRGRSGGTKWWGCSVDISTLCMRGVWWRPPREVGRRRRFSAAHMVAPGSQ